MSTRIFNQPANTWLNQYVYKNFKPSKIGKIIEIIPTPTGFTNVKVKWEDLTEETLTINHLRSVESLIQEHERKLEKHTNHLNKVKEKL